MLGFSLLVSSILELSVWVEHGPMETNFVCFGFSLLVSSTVKLAVWVEHWSWVADSVVCILASILDRDKPCVYIGSSSLLWGEAPFPSELETELHWNAVVTHKILDLL